MLGNLGEFRKSIIIIILVALIAISIAVAGCSTKVEVSKSTEGVKEGAGGAEMVELKRPEVVKSGSEALKLLEDGNKRFAEDRLASKDVGSSRRAELVEGQKPFAIILSCSDSRVPPEIVFDEGLGDLFVIRVAGNVADTVALGSIEYAVEHLHVPLLIVMGHSGCGAVKATVEGGDIPPNIAAIAEKIKPSVDIAKSKEKEEDAIIEAAVTENVKAVIKDIKAHSSIVKEMSESGKLKVVGAKYDLKTGEVEFIDSGSTE